MANWTFHRSCPLQRELRRTGPRTVDCEEQPSLPGSVLVGHHLRNNVSSTCSFWTDADCVRVACRYFLSHLHRRRHGIKRLRLELSCNLSGDSVLFFQMATTFDAHALRGTVGGPAVVVRGRLAKWWIQIYRVASSAKSQLDCASRRVTLYASGTF